MKSLRIFLLSGISILLLSAYCEPNYDKKERAVLKGRFMYSCDSLVPTNQGATISLQHHGMFGIGEGVVDDQGYFEIEMPKVTGSCEFGIYWVHIEIDDYNANNELVLGDIYTNDPFLNAVTCKFDVTTTDQDTLYFSKLNSNGYDEIKVAGPFGNSYVIDSLADLWGLLSFDLSSNSLILSANSIRLNDKSFDYTVAFDTPCSYPNTEVIIDEK